MAIKMDQILGSENLADELDNEVLKSIGNNVVDGYIIDEKSRKEWRERHAHALKQARQVIEKKNIPWDNAANVKYPLMLIAGLQFHGRAYPALTPSQGLAQGKVIGRDPQGMKLAQAVRMAIYMDFQLLDEQEEWEEEWDRLLITLPFTGCEFKKMYYDADLDRNVSEHISSYNFVVDYYTKNLENCRRQTEIREEYKHEIQTKMRTGEYKLCALSWSDRALDPRAEDLGEAQDMAAGVTKVTDDPNNVPRLILEQHCYLDLDGDDYEEPYVVIVDMASRKVLRIVPRFTEDTIIPVGEDSFIIKPEQYYVKYGFIPSPDGGFYDMGFGTLIGPLNGAVDTLINQLLDAGTLSNMQSGFISKRLRVANGRLEFKPGEWKVVRTSDVDISRGIVPLPVREPSMVLFQLLGLLTNAGERVASVSDMMVGENPGQNQKATTSQIVMEQGMKIFTGIYKRLRRAMGKELKVLANLNALYLTRDKYMMILDLPEEEMAQLGEAETDFGIEGLNVIPSADPNIATQMQRIQQASAVLQLTTVNRFEAERQFMEALGIPNIETLQVNPTDMPPSIEEQELQLKKKEQQDNYNLKLGELIQEAEDSKSERALKFLELQIKEKQVEGDIVMKSADNAIKAKGAARANSK